MYLFCLSIFDLEYYSHGGQTPALHNRSHHKNDIRPANQDPMPKYGCVTAFRGVPAIGIKPRIARSSRILVELESQSERRE